MKDPIRLLDGAGSDAERALLRAGAVEEPPADGAHRIAAALGLPLAITAAPPAPDGGAQSAVGGAEAAASTAPGAVATGVAAKLALKWLAIAGAGAAIAAAAAMLRAPSVQPRRAPAEHSPEARTAPAAGKVVEPAPGAGDAVDPKPGAAASEQADEPAAARRDDPAEDPARAQSIAREIEQLDLARARLQRGQPRAALAVLDAYERDHARGALAQEAALLRIEALARAGDRAATRQHAKRFLRAHPDSPHEPRVRALADGARDAR